MFSNENVGQSGASDVYSTHSGGQSLNPEQVVTQNDHSNPHSQTTELSERADTTSTEKNDDAPLNDADEQIVEEESESKKSIARRQPSTTEYLPGMIHSYNALGLLPKFSSWSLRCLGKYSIYSPTQGEWIRNLRLQRMYSTQRKLFVKTFF